MDVQFTKGPWSMERTGDGKRIVIGAGLVEGPGGYDVAEVYSDDCPHELAEANARLIASAPDLYEAALAAKNILRPCLDEPLRTAFWKLSNALAKARLSQPPEHG